MSARVKRNFGCLKVLKQAKPAQRKAILHAAPTDLILCLAEIIDNLLHGTVSLTPQQRKKLTRYKSVLRNIADRKISIKKKRNLLVQKGGFLPGVIGAILPLVTSLIGGLFNK